MIVSRRWLEALLGRALDARETADRLTMHVAPVDAVVPLHQDLGDIVVARVLEVLRDLNRDGGPAFAILRRLHFATRRFDHLRLAGQKVLRAGLDRPRLAIFDSV